MTTTTQTSARAVVLPLQRQQQGPRVVDVLPHREHPPVPDGRYAAPKPDPTDHAWWDAETEALFVPWRPSTAHGRRCACCRPALADPTEVAS